MVHAILAYARLAFHLSQQQALLWPFPRHHSSLLDPMRPPDISYAQYSDLEAFQVVGETAVVPFDWVNTKYTSLGIEAGPSLSLSPSVHDDALLSALRLHFLFWKIKVKCCIQVYWNSFLGESSVKCYWRLRNNASSTLWNAQKCCCFYLETLPETVVQHGVR